MCFLPFRVLSNRRPHKGVRINRLLLTTPSPEREGKSKLISQLWTLSINFLRYILTKGFFWISLIIQESWKGFFGLRLKKKRLFCPWVYHFFWIHTTYLTLNGFTCSSWSTGLCHKIMVDKINVKSALIIPLKSIYSNNSYILMNIEDYFSYIRF